MHECVSLGHLKNIVCYHFGRKLYREKKNKKDHKKARLLIRAKRLVETQSEVEAQHKALGGTVRVDNGEATGGSDRGDGDSKVITFKIGPMKCHVTKRGYTSIMKYILGGRHFT